MKFVFKTLILSLSFLIFSENAGIFLNFKSENEVKLEETTQNITNFKKDLENLKSEEIQLKNKIASFKVAEQPNALIIKDGILSPERLESYLKEKRVYEESLLSLNN